MCALYNVVFYDVNQLLYSLKYNILRNHSLHKKKIVKEVIVTLECY